MISVIIPTRNRAKLLAAALESIRDQELDRDFFEVLIVDNGSTDHTKEVFLKFQKSRLNLKYFFVSSPGLHEGRHRGVMEAQYDILVFADDDIVAEPKWLSAYYKVFQDSAVSMAGGNNLPLYMRKPPAWITELWDRSEKSGIRQIPQFSVLEMEGAAQPHNPHLVWGCNFAVRKGVVIQAGGFHPDGMPRDLIHLRGDGETHISNYVKENDLVCMFHPEATVFHKVTESRMTFRYFYERGFGQGISNSFSSLRVKLLRGQSIYQAFPLRLFLSLLSSCSISLLKMRVALAAYYWGQLRGYYFHQRKCRKDEGLIEWISRENYLS